LITIQPAVTSILPFLEGVYDIEMVAASVTYRLLQGKATISREVTR
jgi:hypothetical protein